MMPIVEEGAIGKRTAWKPAAYLQEMGALMIVIQTLQTSSTGCLESIISCAKLFSYD